MDRGSHRFDTLALTENAARLVAAVYIVTILKHSRQAVDFGAGEVYDWFSTQVMRVLNLLFY